MRARWLVVAVLSVAATGCIPPVAGGGSTTTSTTTTLVPPRLTSIGPTAEPPRAGTTYDDPVAVVTLSGPARGDTVVAVSSSNTGCLRVSDATVPSGSTSAPVIGSAVNACPSVRLTATLGPDTATLDLEVPGPA
jgi:hypothetical protein